MRLAERALAQQEASDNILYEAMHVSEGAYSMKKHQQVELVQIDTSKIVNTVSWMLRNKKESDK